jgi:hypothetical protein
VYDAACHCTLDVCATADNAQCPRSFSPAMDGLAQDWSDDSCWMHPPSGPESGLWREKAYRSSLAGATVVCFIPARTGTRWWPAWVLGKGELRSRQGRLTFEGATAPAGCDALAVLYRPPRTHEETRGGPRRRLCQDSENNASARSPAAASQSPTARPDATTPPGPQRAAARSASGAPRASRGSRQGQGVWPWGEQTTLGAPRGTPVRCGPRLWASARGVSPPQARHRNRCARQRFRSPARGPAVSGGQARG